MTQRKRKLVGTLTLIAVVVAYMVAVGAVYANFLGGAEGWVLIAFFAVAGLAWFFPAAWIVRWMSRPDT